MRSDTSSSPGHRKMGGQIVHSEEDFETLIRGVMGASNRSREVLITDSPESARTVALLRRGDTSGEVIITQIDEGIHAVGVLSRTGEYDDGMPLIVDLREDGQLLEFEGTFIQAPNGINVEIWNGDLELVSLNVAEEDGPSL